jgi:hypothetical protein
VRSDEKLTAFGAKQKQLSTEEIEHMATVYREFKHDHVPDAVRGEGVALCSFPNVTKSLP